MVMELKNLFIKYIKLREKLDNGKIYKIVDNTNGNVYIGSTCQTLKNRLSHHKSNYKAYLKGLYSNITSFDIIKNDNYKIELLENCNTKTKQELFEREKYYIQNNSCVNKIIPSGTQKKTQKEYRDANKDKLNEKNICICGGKYTHKHKTTHLKSAKHLNFLENNN